MGKMKPNPRYNVVSCRVSDEMKQSLSHARGNCTVQEYIHAAIEEKLISDRQARIDAHIRANR